MKFKVTVMERTVSYRFKEFDAPDEDTARELAEAENWTDWEEDYENTECCIEEIEEVQQ